MHLDNPAGLGPAGTVHASLRDWATFIRLHLVGGDARLELSPETIRRLHTPPGPGADYALGWIVADDQPWAGGPALTHGGSNTFWFCVTWIAPAKDFAVLVVTNVTGKAAETGCDEVAGLLIRKQLTR